MLDQVKARLAAIKMPFGIYDVVKEDISSHRPEKSESEAGLTFVACGKERCHAENIPRKGNNFSARTGRMKENAIKSLPRKFLKENAEDRANTPTKTARRPVRGHGNMKGVSNIGKKKHSNITDVIIDPFVSQSGDRLKKCLNETSRKSGKPKGADNISWPLTEAVHNTRKARPKSSLRQLKTKSILKPTMKVQSAIVATGFKESARDKAGNNNWMLDNDETSDIASTLVVPTFHTKSRASSFSSFIQTNSSSKSIFRASSSDDSGCFSNTKRDSQARLYAAQHNESLGDSKHTSSGPRMCSICRNQSLEQGWHLCKSCSGRTRQDGVCSGPLNELKAYAQCIANSVKKILLLSPGSEDTDELDHKPTPKRKEHKKMKNMPHTEGAPIKGSPEVALHRYMTEINMASIPETRSKSLLNKSVSYDGRVGTCFEEKDRCSPLYWLSQDKVIVSDSLSKLSNSITFANLDDDYCAPEKECKHLTIQDGDKNHRIGKIDKSKPKISLKQLARVERARTDGDLRANPLQQNIPNKKIGKNEHKKGLEFQRNRSKTFHEVDADIDEFCEYSSKQLEETDSSDAVNISRQKVIHEGSPVDPPYSCDNRKMEDNKGRKAVFIRSATAPYRNHLAKKDIATGDKFSAIEGVVKTNKSNTKATFRTNKASTLRKENSLSDKKKVQELLEPQQESWKDDTPAISNISIPRRRSTSCDGRKPLHPRKDELHRSISWSMVEGDDEGSKQRRAAASASNISAKRQQEQGGVFYMNVMPSRFSERGQKEHQFKNMLSTDTFHRESSTDNFKYQARETSFEKSPSEIPKDMIPPNAEDLVEQTQPQSLTYFNSMRYYGHDKENSISPCKEYVVEDKSITHLETESYYCYTKTAANNQLADSELKANTQNSISFYKSVGNEDVYHEQIANYTDSDVSNGKTSPWYSPLQETASEQKTVGARERSLESKSSTSFHLVTNTKSSHSDDSLMKYFEVCEHTTPRKQSMYTETDVDTGLIYHLAKHQTTRAYVPPYHDLTSASRDFYTMSGDVSTSTSSNSSISIKSEISESAYTGGFYKEDPFYNGGKNSEESSSYIYFEPDGKSKRVPSELDIYTGSIFNGNQNTISLAQDTRLNKTKTLNEVTKDGSTNNSARSLMGRTQRHLRYRPRNDAITFRNNALAWEYLPQPVLVCGGAQSYDSSNNSNNWFAFDEFDSSMNQGSIVTKSKEPLYTDYDPGMRPEFHVKTIEKTAPVFDFLKYENSGEPTRSGPFSSPQIDNSSGDNKWYSGLFRSPSNECLETQNKRTDKSPDRSMFSWQYSDDYYTSNVRPKTGRSNKYTVGAQGKITQDTNNNHFEDIYTGSYGAQNIAPRVQEQPAPVRQPPTEDWYLSQPTPKLTSSTCYDQKYDNLYAGPDVAKRSSSDILESKKDPRASSSVFAHDNASYSGSSTYVSDDIFRKYDQSHSSLNAVLEEPPQRRSRVIAEKSAHEETDSYFNYAINRSSDRGFYTIEDTTYSFEPKVVKETPKVPVVPEIKTVGGIVCRENVANKEDYAEDINRDLEAGPWSPFAFRCADEAKYPMESSDGRSPEGQGHNFKHMEDNSYAHDRTYDNSGARNKWREMATKKDNEVTKTKDTSHYRTHQGGDTGKQDHTKSRTMPDLIPDKARGKRANSTISKSTVSDYKGSNSSKNKKH